VTEPIVILIDRGQVKSIATEYATTIANDKATTVELWLEEKITTIKTISRTEVIKSLDKAQYLPFLQEVFEDNEDIYGRYFVIDQQGMMTDTLGISKDLSNDEGYIKA
jgi:hypothetical protein